MNFENIFYEIKWKDYDDNKNIWEFLKNLHNVKKNTEIVKEKYENTKTKQIKQVVVQKLFRTNIMIVNMVIVVVWSNFIKTVFTSAHITSVFFVIFYFK